VKDIFGIKVDLSGIISPIKYRRGGIVTHSIYVKTYGVKGIR